MKHSLLLVSLILFVGCATQKTRENVLLPTIRSSFENSSPDITLGLDGAVSSGGMTQVQVDLVIAVSSDLLGSMQGNGDGSALLDRWTQLEPWAQAGVNSRVASGAVSEGVAESLRERLRLLTEAMLKYDRSL